MSKLLDPSMTARAAAREINRALRTNNCWCVYLFLPGNDHGLKISSARVIKRRLWVALLGACNLHPVDDYNQISLQ